ncbi:PQQ-dependent sugar dehydrogenase [Glycomyces terrestris]|uniref:PKD domain-containing protein n=1 Tax=Glycomyces terrestris TaxID=2493553 RepID=A0A426UTR0_9ACTN|nr:PQQ-dependent sugar dehydrogenase [Glycomyces terrestris]RRR97394.1 PKD domain-containing protein [Glycomyces terrestris]
MPGRRLGRLAVGAVVGAALLTAPGAAEAAPPDEFEKLLVVGGLEEPTSFRFTPDGDVLVAEKNGDIELVHDGVLHEHPLIELATAGSDERGLLGLELDPDFASNGYVYVGYTAADNLDRLSRFTMSGHAIDPGSELVLIQSQQDANVFHHSGSVKFGPDGKLYWTLGMNTNNQNPPNLGNVHGKMHRVNADGSIPPDNPFVDTPGAEPSVWAYGLRNSFRWDFVPSGPNAGSALAGDVGGSEWEELNLVERGANYGWPHVEGVCADCPYAQPVYAYPHTAPPASAGSISAVEVYEGGLLGPAFEDAVFIADYTLGFVKYLEMDEAFETVVAVHDFDTEAGTPVELQTGPDGALYQLNIYPGELYRIAPSGGNRTPVAAAAATPDSGYGPLEVAFSSAGSSDPDGDALAYEWDFGDGTGATGPDPVHTYAADGVYQAVLTVSDGQKTASAQVEVQVGNTRPEAVVLTPAAGLTYDGGDVVAFSGEATDPEDGALGAASLSWTVQFHHADHVHPFHGPAEGAGGEITIPTAPHGGDNTFYRITLTATDSGGLTDTASVDVHPNTVEVAIATDPPGLEFTLDGRPLESAAKRMVVGTEYVLGAESPQYAGDDRYRFAGWSTGAGQQHVFTVPAEDTAVTAVFEELPYPPEPWESTDVGERTQLGLSSFDPGGPGGGAFAVTGAGWDVWGGTDEFHFVHRALAGDGSITARLTAQGNTNPWAKAGVMVKESAAEGAPYAAIAVTPEHGAHFQADFGTDGGGFAYEAGSAWLRLTRAGDLFTAELSPDGETWTVIGSAEVPMAAGAQVGLFATAHDNTRFSTAVFDHVAVAAAPPELTCADVGDPALAGSAAFGPDGSVALTGAGDDVWGDADQFHYCYRELAGDGEIIARVASLEHTNDWAKAGVMVKSGPTEGAAYAAAMATAAEGVHFQTAFDRDVDGPAAAAPVWLRLVRDGDTVTAYHSADGASWEPFASAAVVGPATIGLFVTSHDGSALSTAVFDSVVVRDTAPAVPEPWTCADVGGPRMPGDAVAAGGTWTIVGAGDDIWGDADQFHYCHQPLAGDGQITARVVSQEHTDDWAKAGVMVKAAPEAGAEYALLAVTPANGVHLQSGFDTDTAGTAAGAPMWLRLSRTGDTVTASWSADGEVWSVFGTVELAGAATMGLFVTSHDGSDPGTAVFDSVAVA